MPPQQNRVSREASLAESYSDIEDQEPGLLDTIRFLYKRRVKLTFHFLAILGFCITLFLFERLMSSKTVEGIVGLDFPEIKAGTYPSGRSFSIEDFRSPGVLMAALAGAGVAVQQISLRDLTAHVRVEPVIPAEIQNRWNKQELSGAKKEVFAPSDFAISIDVDGLTDQERLHLFDGLVSRYQETVKYDQESAQMFVSSSDLSYEKLAGKYDPWDMPEIIGSTYRTLSEHLQSLVKDSSKYQDPGYRLSFLEIAKDLDTWDRTRLQPLEALTYQGKLVKNRDLISQRILFRLQQLEISIHQKSQEAVEASRLLEIISRPRVIVAGQFSAKEGFPIIDAGTLDKLIKSDHVGPVVKRISALQVESKELSAEKDRLEKQLSLLPKTTAAGSGSLPPEYENLITSSTTDLATIVQKYDHALDDYLAATINSLVVVRQAPVLSRAGYSATFVLPVILLLSAFLAVLLLGIEYLFERARTEDYRGISRA